MNDLEQNVRDAMHRRAGDVDGGSVWPPRRDLRAAAARSNVPNSTPMRVVLALSVVITVVVASLGGLWLVNQDGGASDRNVASLPAPAGQQAVAFRGVQVFVPASFALEIPGCDGLQGDHVRVGADGTQALCFAAQTVGFTTVVLRPYSEASNAELAALARTPATVSGVDALRGSRPLIVGGSEYVLVVPSKKVAVGVRTTSPSLAATILDSAAIVAVDTNGCETEAPGELHAGTTPPASAATGAMVAEPVDGASVCLYRRNIAERSATLDAASAQVLATSFNALSAGTSRPQGPIDGPGSCPDADARYLVTFRSGPDDLPPVTVVFASCTDLFVTNGSDTSALTYAVMQDLFRKVPYIGSFRMPA